jgi:hypothetical protein
MIRRVATRVSLAAVPNLHLAIKQNPEVRTQDEIPTGGTGQLAVTHSVSPSTSS